jgi:hypothetical protein
MQIVNRKSVIFSEEGEVGSSENKQAQLIVVQINNRIDDFESQLRF